MKNSKFTSIKLNSLVNNYKCDNASFLYAYLNAKIEKMIRIQDICDRIGNSLYLKSLIGKRVNTKYAFEMSEIFKDASFKEANLKRALFKLEESIGENTFHSFKLAKDGKVEIITK